MNSFLTEAPLRQARRYANADLAERALPGQIRWLHEHPVLWLRALVEAELDLNEIIRKDTLRLKALRPASGEPQRAYLDAKTLLEQTSSARKIAKRKIERRRADVVTLVGTDRPLITGDLIHNLTVVLSLIEHDEPEQAADLLHYFIDRLTRAKEATS